MAVDELIKKIQERLRQNIFASEAAVSQGILLPVLRELGWPVFDTAVVVPDYSIEGCRVDYALYHLANRPSVFVEVKKTGLAEGADRQLFEYAFHIGVPMSILTDGQEWSFYLPGEQGRYDERRVYKIDLLERTSEEASTRLTRYLAYERVCTGEALKAVRADYQDVARGRLIETTFPRAWDSLLQEEDSLLIDLLAEKVEGLCGYRPDQDDCRKFLKRKIRPAEQGETVPIKITQPATAPIKRGVSKTRGDMNESFEVVLPISYIKWGGLSVKKEFRQKVFKDILPLKSTKGKRYEFTINIKGFGEVKAWRTQDRIKIQSSQFREMVKKLDLSENSKLTIKTVKRHEYYYAHKS